MVYDKNALAVQDLGELDQAVRAMWQSPQGRIVWAFFMKGDLKTWPLLGRYVSEKLLENIETMWK